ncbi:MAG TPA: hypothetical protein PLD79_02855, partial [Halothiobacillus sp.]
AVQAQPCTAVHQSSSTGDESQPNFVVNFSDDDVSHFGQAPYRLNLSIRLSNTCCPACLTAN